MSNCRGKLCFPWLYHLLLLLLLLLLGRDNLQKELWKPTGGGKDELVCGDLARMAIMKATGGIVAVGGFWRLARGTLNCSVELAYEQ